RIIQGTGAARAPWTIAWQRAARMSSLVDQKVEHRRRDDVAVGEQDTALHAIRGFSVLAGPAVGDQEIPRIGRKRARWEPIVGARLSEEVLGERDDVAAAVAQ